jgi:hypothetical protein
MCEYHLRLLYIVEEFGEISNIDSFVGSEHSLYNFLLYWVTYGLNSVSFFGCPPAATVRENLWIGIIVMIVLFIFLGAIRGKKD